MINEGSDASAVLLEEKAEEKPAKNILFVCTGNTCRSPMAAALFNYLYMMGELEKLDDRYQYHATSAGVAAHFSPISENAAAALMNRGILPTPGNEYTQHVSRMVTRELIMENDFVVGVSSGHKRFLTESFPEFASKFTSLGDDISDPYGMNLTMYEKCLSQIEESIRNLVL